ncbi:MAG: hypothetical protein ACFFD4_23580 [Candidatus Odinarchaeota archaeon]
MLKIALDTGCLNVKGKHPILNELEQLEKDGHLEITTSSVLEREQMEKNVMQEWRDRYLSKINKHSKEYEVMIIGRSEIGKAVLGSERVRDIIESTIQSDPKNDYDKWILHTAIVNQNDYFLTLNPNDFINNGKQERLETLGILIREPDNAFLDELKQKLGLQS